MDKFRTGDKVAITLLHCLTDDKTYIIKGTIIAITGGKNYLGRFTLRNHHSGAFYEVSYPFWSPFIRRLELLEKTDTPYKKKKQGYYIRQWDMQDPRNRAL
jgi:ribosomal protein L19